MKLRVAVLDHDTEFMNRLMKVFQQKFSEKISLSLFSSEDTLYEGLKGMHADAVLADESIKLHEERLPEGMTIGYLSSISNVNEIEGVPAICKYQKAETVYKMILSLCAENSTNIKLKKKSGDVRVVFFTSVQGGSGTSAAAAAYALVKASEKKKVFYLNLEQFGNTDLYFTGDGNLSFSDVIYSLKSKKSNLAMKLESAAQKDLSGVHFFHPCKNAYDMFELRDDETEELVQEISQAMEYEEIVIDLSGNLTERMVSLMENAADRIVYVTDGSLVGNDKFERFCEAVRVIENRKGYSILEKTGLLYNRYSSKYSSQLEKTGVPVIGGIHRFEGAAGKELAEKIAQAGALSMV